MYNDNWSGKSDLYSVPSNLLGDGQSAGLVCSEIISTDFKNSKDIDCQIKDLKQHMFKDEELMSLSTFLKHPNGIIVSVESREINGDGRILSDNYEKFLHLQSRGLLLTCCGHLKTTENSNVLWKWKRIVIELESQCSTNQELIECVYAEMIRKKLYNTQIMCLDTINKKLTIIEQGNKGLFKVELSSIKDTYMRSIGSELIDPFCFYELSKENHSFNTTENALLFLNNYYALTMKTAEYFTKELRLTRVPPYGGKIHHFIFDNDCRFVKKI